MSLVVCESTKVESISGAPRAAILRHCRFQITRMLMILLMILDDDDDDD